MNGKNEAKRFKAADLAPTNANKEVYASIFTSSRKSDLRRRIRADLCHLVGTDEVWFMWKVQPCGYVGELELDSMLSVLDQLVCVGAKTNGPAF
ncbi:hypothetical protein HanPI659440_Chr05g0212111 [Helianthus annuus]|nr:hypothetical protein HanPI659440_Chr05g0212111 [Helianthus annuus]